MAFQKTITQVSAGIAASYWRIVNIHLDANTFSARVVMAGYVSADIRQANGQFIDMREYVLTVPQFAALARSKPEGDDVYGVLATALYNHIRSAPRAVPPGAMFDPETGDVTIPATGEVIPVARVTLNEHSMPTWLPSEFADAQDV